MKILEYNDIDYSKVRRQYEKVAGYIEKGDFRAASVKKFPEHDLYCARLDDTNRLLFKLLKHNGTQYALTCGHRIRLINLLWHISFSLILSMWLSRGQ